MLTIPQDHLALWSPEELAEALGVKEQTLADWRNARTVAEGCDQLSNTRSSSRAGLASIRGLLT